VPVPNLAPGPDGYVIGLDPSWVLITALGWWWTRFVAAWLWFGLLELLSVLAPVLRVVVVRPAVWAWGLPRENQAVLATTLTAAGMGVYATREMLADTRPWSEVLGPPAWALGIITALFIARCVTRPIVLLVPFGFAVWWISPSAALILVGLTVVATGWATHTRSGRTHMTKRRTLLGSTTVRASFAPDRRGYAPGPGLKEAGASRFVAHHEGGHAAALVASGGKLIRARAFADGSGYCEGRLPCRPSLFQAVVDDVAWSVGGEVAVHSSAGCGPDHKMRDSALGLLPKHQQPMARTAGYATARRAQHTHRYIRDRVAAALMATGRYA
jgi:hypothetical protein